MLDFDFDFLFVFFFGALAGVAPNPPPAKQTLVRLLIPNCGDKNAVTLEEADSSRRRIQFIDNSFVKTLHSAHSGRILIMVDDVGAGSWKFEKEDEDPWIGEEKGEVKTKR